MNLSSAVSEKGVRYAIEPIGHLRDIIFRSSCLVEDPKVLMPFIVLPCMHLSSSQNDSTTLPSFSSFPSATEFPAGCITYSGPHTTACLNSFWTGSGCLADVEGMSLSNPLLDILELNNLNLL